MVSSCMDVIQPAVTHEERFQMCKSILKEGVSHVCLFLPPDPLCLPLIAHPYPSPTPHQSPLTNHPSPITPHPSLLSPHLHCVRSSYPLTTIPSPFTALTPSPLTAHHTPSYCLPLNHPSPLTPHLSPFTEDSDEEDYRGEMAATLLPSPALLPPSSHQPPSSKGLSLLAFALVINQGRVTMITSVEEVSITKLRGGGGGEGEEERATCTCLTQSQSFVCCVSSTRRYIVHMYVHRATGHTESETGGHCKTTVDCAEYENKHTVLARLYAPLE